MLALSPPPEAPAVISLERLGKPAFREDFTSFDAGPDQSKPPRPHRWRTVLGSGGPAALENRSFGGDVVFVDPAFTGLDGPGRLGSAPLGLSPFSILPEGGLQITARRTSPDLKAKLWGKGWYSGIITTKFSFSQPTGYWEIVADIPLCTKGTWSAIWLLPTVGTWPVGGEIDGPEAVGNGKLAYAVHSSAAKDVIGAYTPPTGCERGYHRYGILNAAKQIAYYYDGKLVSTAPRPADFGQPMYLLIDLAMGGSWAGPPDAQLNSEVLKIKSVTAWKAGPSD